MNHVKTRGYKIILIMTYVNKESALHRISRRTEQPLDLKIANEIYQQIQKYAEKYMSIEDIDMIYLYNNELETELIYKKTMKKVFCMSPFSNFYFDVSKFC